MKDVIPVFVPVREYYVQRETGASLSSFLGKRVAEMIGEEEDAVVGLLKRNRVMLLLDGLDEVKSDDARKLVAEEIEGMIRASGEIPCIVSSRPAGYRTARLTRSLPHLELDGFDDKRINELLFNWYKRIIGMEYRDSTEKEIEQRAQDARDDLFGRFNSFEGLLDLVRNPLMLTIAIFIHHIGLELPERRADFYFRAAQLLSRTWLRVKFRDRIELSREETLMDALERIAFKLHTEGSGNLISGDNLSELLLKLFKEREAYANVKAE
ncbi:MAG: NACHT domain-containing protein, partial [bacterium]|nr:NACHT domain-containing protein [bacterium]